MAAKPGRKNVAPPLDDDENDAAADSAALAELFEDTSFVDADGNEVHPAPADPEPDDDEEDD